MGRSENIFCCPRCKKPAHVHETRGQRNFVVETLVTPYFLCPDCRLIFISRKLVRIAVSEWWRGNKLKRTAPLRYFYGQAIKYLYESVLNCHKRVGYRLARFKKI